jgi:hypothetical protein
MPSTGDPEPHPPLVEPHPRALGLVAAILAIAVVAALFGPRLLAYIAPQLGCAMPPSSVASPSTAGDQPAPVAAVPMQFRLGSWTVTLEVADATSSFVRVQALIDGASLEDLNLRPGVAWPVTLLDASDTPLIQTAASAGVTVPKQQLNPCGIKRTRINAEWRRPATAGTLQLRFEGSGSVVKIPLNLPALNETGRVSLGPTDFPAADESLTLTGSLAADIKTARPSQCGAVVGAVIRIFAFAIYFQSGGAWYWLAFTSDQYPGPGTYATRASLYTVGPNGPNNLLSDGTVQLTVTSDRGPDTSTVSGTLTGLEVSGPQSKVMVSGNWTCSPGSNLVTQRG